MQMILLDKIIRLVIEHEMATKRINLFKTYMWIMFKMFLLTLQLHLHIEVSSYCFNF